MLGMSTSTICIYTCKIVVLSVFCLSVYLSCRIERTDVLVHELKREKKEMEEDSGKVGGWRERGVRK